MVEYWSGQKNDFIFPKDVKFEYKTDTDLFEFVAVRFLEGRREQYIVLEMHAFICWSRSQT